MNANAYKPYKSDSFFFRRIATVVKHALYLLLAVLAVVLVMFSTTGIPLPLVKACIRLADLRNLSIEVEHARLDPFRGIVFSGVSVYRKRIIGPAVLDAEKLILHINPLSRFYSDGYSGRIMMHGAVLRPEMFWYERPDIPEPIVAGKYSWQVQVVGDSCEIWGVHIERMRLLVSYAYPVYNVKLEDGFLRDGFDLQRNIYGSAVFDVDTDVMDGEFSSGFHPRVLLPVLDMFDMPFTARLVNDFVFGHAPPRVDSVIRFDRQTRQWDYQGGVWLPECRFRNVVLSQGNGKVVVRKTVDDTSLLIDPLVLVRPEGVARGFLSTVYSEQSMGFNIESGFYPPALFKMVGFSSEHVLLERCRYEGPSFILGKGMIGFGDNERDDFSFSFIGENFTFEPFTATRCRVDGYASGREYFATNIVAEYCGGTVSGELALLLPEEDGEAVAYNIELLLQQADFSEMLEQLQVERAAEVSGVIGGNIRVAGLFNEDAWREARGEGTVRIRRGHLFRLPLFGGLSEVMSRVVPGLDFVLRQSDADADYIISDGYLISRRTVAQGDVFSLEGSGRYDMVDDRLDYLVQVKLMKEHTLVARVLRTLTYPMSKLLEFRLRGSLGEPHWYPVNFSTDLLRRLGSAPDAIRSVFSSDDRDKQ